MATKQEIAEGVRSVEERLERLLPGIRANLDRPLTSGTWSIHDAVCHMAADANAVPRYLQRIERMQRGEPGRPPGFNGDVYNDEQIALRKPKTLEAVLAEINDGLAADLAAIEAMDEAFLAQQFPNPRGEPVAASDTLRFYLTGHNHLHLDDIEKALAAQA